MLVPKVLAALVGQVIPGHIFWTFLRSLSGPRFYLPPSFSLVLSQLEGTSPFPPYAPAQPPQNFCQGAVLTIMVETSGDFIAKSLLASTFLGLLVGHPALLLMEELSSCPKLNGL